MTENEIILALRNELHPIKEDIREVKENINDLKIYVENEIEPKIKLLF